MSRHLAIENLTVVRGGREIVAGLSASVAAGASLLLLGPNGAGKTTVLRAIAGLLPAAAGRIVLNGEDAEKSIAEQAHTIGHGNAVKGSLTVFENARFWASYLGGTPERIAAALDRFQISALADIPARYLSAGQQRRLGLSRLLLAERPLWLLDEPTSSLDAAGQDIVAAVVNEHLDGGGLAVVATHLPLRLCRAAELRLETPVVSA